MQLQMILFLNYLDFINHPLEDDFQSHGVTAAEARAEKIAIAGPHSLIIFNGMRVVCTVHGYLEIVEVKPIALIGIPFRFFYFADQAIIHDPGSFH